MTNEQIVEANQKGLNSFLSAWSTREPEAVLSAVHPEFEYAASVGPEPGSTWRTRAELIQGLEAMFKFDDGAQVTVAGTHIAGDFGILKWQYRFNRADGTIDVSIGCDLLEFRDGKLLRKDSYRKLLIKPTELVRMPARTSALPTSNYQRRHFCHRGTWAIKGLTIKAYGIALDPTAIADEMWIAARSHVEAEVDQIARERSHHGLGFVILHQGKDATWLLLDWWAHDDIRCQLMFVARSEGNITTKFEPVTEPFAGCVWEELVISAERNTWVQTMLTTDPDRSAYLDAVLPDGWL